MPWAIAVSPILTKQEEIPSTTNSSISKMKEYASIYKKRGSKPVMN